MKKGRNCPERQLRSSRCPIFLHTSSLSQNEEGKLTSFLARACSAPSFMLSPKVQVYCTVGKSGRTGGKEIR